MSISNYDLKDDIRDYWSKRAEGFDGWVSHTIKTAPELQAWATALAPHIGQPKGAGVLELAFGTGELTRVLLHLDYRVTGLDIAEPMLERARAKHARDKGRVRFYLGDAEATMMGDGEFDAIISRHLAWTLTDPDAAFAEWFRVVKPGGRVVVIDGDWVRCGPVSKLRRWLVAQIDRLSGEPPPWDPENHQRIRELLPFRAGLRFEVLAARLEAAGFTDIRRGSLDDVFKAQLKGVRLRDRLLARSFYDHTFICSAQRPA